MRGVRDDGATADADADADVGADVVGLAWRAAVKGGPGHTRPSSAGQQLHLETAPTAPDHRQTQTPEKD